MENRERFLVQIVKPNGMKNHYGKEMQKINVKIGTINPKEADLAFLDEKSCETERANIVNKVRSNGIYISESKVVSVKVF